jgi:hypothetical protein
MYSQVLRVAVSLEGRSEETLVHHDAQGELVARFEVSKNPNPIAEITAFLNTNPMAKIIYVIDTHSIENGYLTYKGNSPKDYEACSLGEVCKCYTMNHHVS